MKIGLNNFGLVAAMALLGIGVAGCASSGSRSMSEKWSDDRTTAHVQKALDDAPLYKYGNVTVSTINGEVQLGGYVALQAQRDQAAQIAANVQGVSRVIDNIQVRPDSAGPAPIEGVGREPAGANNPTPPPPNQTK